MEKFVTVTIDPKGKGMQVEMDGFQGVGCQALMEAFNNMGTTVEQHDKPEAYECGNHNYLSAGN